MCVRLRAGEGSFDLQEYWASLNVLPGRARCAMATSLRSHPWPPLYIIQPAYLIKPRRAPARLSRPAPPLPAVTAGPTQPAVSLKKPATAN
ncbi:hypothetical protein SKAU_G00311540 [Synaphobranchus kaupii]|uniref:Uncharacterized protein n=1 Tax=Synaphobranchus kaupii TaxID=118154 RepID=A0A9Q1ILE5_SYNKA|nr:hypothetical protein SKAU_G00311540 [Synaphobranchus kaupii]